MNYLEEGFGKGVLVGGYYGLAGGPEGLVIGAIAGGLEGALVGGTSGAAAGKVCQGMGVDGRK